MKLARSEQNGQIFARHSCEQSFGTRREQLKREGEREETVKVAIIFQVAVASIERAEEEDIDESND